ncbi:cytochrome P450 [Ectobacillus sp. sgz5001026]|uniref:cytochrome P450 n=1 Tax=Ectobacillus sp. sgz5001026 TaxID=3242473 RepID=UPI0036D41D0E
MTKMAQMEGLQVKKYIRFRKDPLTFLYDTHTLGDMVAINPRGKNVSYIVHSPEAVKEILTTKEQAFIKGASAKTFSKTLGNGVLTSEGDEHQRQRKLVQPAFHKKKIASYAEVAVKYAKELVDTWQDGERIPIHTDMMNLTLRIITKTMFGVDMKEKSAGIAEAVNAIIEKTAATLLSPFPIVDKLPTEKNRKGNQAVKELHALADWLMEEAAKQDEDHMLHMLMQSTHDDGMPLTKQEIRDQVVTFLIAGHETTANALTWTLVLLAKHPQEVEKLKQELSSVLGGRLPTFEDVPKLTYSSQIVQETLRLYPPAWIILREAIEDVEIAGVPFSKGSTFLISPYAVHRNPHFFEQSEEFVPERFSKERKEAIPNYAYFPFGAGSRGCIGSQFAMMEAVLILAVVMQTANLSIVDEMIATEPLVSLRAHGPVPMTVSK